MSQMHEDPNEVFYRVVTNSSLDLNMFRKHTSATECYVKTVFLLFAITRGQTAINQFLI